jgi:K+-sensing histidine kinase KdpD
MAGNLLDNAFKWTRRTVTARATAEDRSVILTIDDDGPGLSAAQIPQVLQPGQRLDENAPLNFFMADMQAGIGPFLGVFLLWRMAGKAA